MEKYIRILPGGPYEVSADIPLNQAEIVIDGEGTSETWALGHPYPAQEQPYHLCRCGHSKEKPYCDGTHREMGFEGEETADKAPYLEKAKRYDGQAVDLLDREDLCASLRFCDRGLGVWDAALQSGDEENLRLAMEEAACCAAGRLCIQDKEGKILEPELPQEISLVEDTAARMRGPLWVKGGIRLVGADGEAYEERNRMTLCRCGESSNLPFCDTSHLRCPHMDGHD